jgi:nucleoid-associated protein YgaU
VTWGILAYLATTPRARRYLSALSAVVSLGVGLTTVYLGTHWLSDVLLGWAAGLLILLGLPWCEPLIGRAEAWILGIREQWRARRAPARSLPVAAGGPRPATAMVPQRGTDEADDQAREPVAAAGVTTARPPAGSASGPAATTRTTTHGPRAHARSERSPVTPSGSRRPPHSRPLTGG